MNLNRTFVVLASLVCGLSVSSTAFGQQYWKFKDGTASIRFERNNLQRAGIQIDGITNTDPTRVLESGVPSWKLNLEQTSLGIVTDHSLFSRFESGEMKVNGGFDLLYKGMRVPFDNFAVIPTDEAGIGLMNVIGETSGQANQPLEMEARTPIKMFDPKAQTFEFHDFELRISPQMAHLMSAPQLEGIPLGSLTISGHVRLAAGPINDPFNENPAPVNHRTVVLDLGVCRLYGLNQWGRETIGGIVYNAFSASTTSINYGTAAIPWKTTGTSINSNLQPEHPVIGLNIYRISNGLSSNGVSFLKYEQIGESNLKHGWFATNASSECTGACTATGSGSGLGTGCTDTYGDNHNAQQNYLGPKSEVNPFTGKWTPEGSWFAQGANDRVRRITDTQRKDPVTGVVSTYPWTPTEKRMKVADTDLGVAGAQYIYEGYYISGSIFANNSVTSAISDAIDVNKYNQYRYRYAIPTFNSGTSTWSWADQATLYTGSALDQWGDSRQFLKPQTVGDVTTAVKTTSLGSGWYMYDYAVYVHDLDRQLDGFNVSCADSVGIRNMQFRDVDKDATNDWIMTRSNGNLRWTMPVSPANPIWFGRTFNFRFEAQVAPVPGWAQGDPLKPGTFPWLTAQITGPTPSVQNVTGTLTIPGRQAAAPTTVSLRLTPLDGGAVTVISNVNVNMPAGTFSAPTTLRGRFNVAVQGLPFLRKAFAPTVSIGPDGNDVPVNVTLMAGDVDGSGEIDAADIDAVIANFGFVGSSPADVDGSAEVDAADIDMVIARFGLVGDA